MRCRDEKINDVISDIMKNLSSFDPWVYHVSKYNSTYIKFKDKNLGTVRIADHKGRDKYKYKWNIRTNKTAKTFVDDSTGKEQYYFSSEDIKRFYRMIKFYKTKV